MKRVTQKMPTLAEGYTGDPALYFYGVAHKVHLEYVRRKPAPAPPPLPTESSDEIERESDCLERCMRQLTADNRELLMQYYQEEKRAKINQRKQLAEQLGIALNALRIRAYRIRATPQQCVPHCLEQSVAG